MGNLKKISTTVYIDPEIKALSAATAVPMSVFYRDSFERGLRKWERQHAAGEPLTFGAEADACAKCESLAALHRRRS